MEIRGNLPENPGINKRYVQKKRSISETNTKRPSLDALQDRAKPEVDFVELEGGFTMYPSEIQDFSSGNDSTL
ncbi:MAG: hypothetical protein KBI01_00360 [Oscillospiraceae bacterium]|nr:hypothetical protein [Oscillospiraceae bacterium]